MIYPYENDKINPDKILPPLYVSKNGKLIEANLDVLVKSMNSELYRDVKLTEEHFKLFNLSYCDISKHYICSSDKKIHISQYRKADDSWAIMIEHNGSSSYSILRLCYFLHEFQMLMFTLTSIPLTFNLNKYNNEHES